MSASITTTDGQTYTGATVPIIIEREWGRDARLHQGMGGGTRTIVERVDGEEYWLATVEDVVHDEGPGSPDVESLRRAHEDLERVREELHRVEADVADAMARRDRVVRAMVEREEAARGLRSGVRGEIAAVLGMTTAGVSRIVKRG